MAATVLHPQEWGPGRASRAHMCIEPRIDTQVLQRDGINRTRQIASLDLLYLASSIPETEKYRGLHTSNFEVILLTIADDLSDERS